MLNKLLEQKGKKQNQMKPHTIFVVDITKQSYSI